MVSAMSSSVPSWAHWEIPVSKKGKQQLHRAYVKRLQLDNIKLKSYVHQLHDAVVQQAEAEESELWAEASQLDAQQPEVLHVKPLGQSQVMAVELAAATTHYQTIVAQLELDKQALQERSHLLQQLITEEGEQRLELMENLQDAHQEIQQLSQQVVGLKEQVASLNAQVSSLQAALQQSTSIEAQLKPPAVAQPAPGAPQAEQVSSRQVFAIAEGIGLHLPTCPITSPSPQHAQHVSSGIPGPGTPQAPASKPRPPVATPPSRLPAFSHTTHTAPAQIPVEAHNPPVDAQHSSGGFSSSSNKSKAGRRSVHDSRVADILNEITKGRRWPKVPPPSLVVTNSRRTLIQPAWRY